MGKRKSKIQFLSLDVTISKRLSMLQDVLSQCMISTSLKSSARSLIQFMLQRKLLAAMSLHVQKLTGQKIHQVNSTLQLEEMTTTSMTEVYKFKKGSLN